MRNGQSHSEEARAKISDAMKGKPKSIDTREKMSLKRSLYWAKWRQKQRAEAQAEYDAHIAQYTQAVLDEGPVKTATDSYDK